SPWLELVEARGGAQASGREVVWSLPGLGVGEQVTVELDARILTTAPDGTRIVNQATVSAPELTAPSLTDNPDTSDVDDPTEVVVVARPALLPELIVHDLNGGM